MDHYFPVVLFSMLNNVVVTFESVDEILKCIQMKAVDHYVPVVLFVMLYNVVLTFKSLGEIIKSDHSNASHSASGGSNV